MSQARTGGREGLLQGAPSLLGGFWRGGSERGGGKARKTLILSQRVLSDGHQLFEGDSSGGGVPYDQGRNWSVRMKQGKSRGEGGHDSARGRGI